MPKINSTRQRIVLMLRTFFKYSDAKHPINLVQMNKFLKPYGLEYNRAIMQETLRDMRASGIDVRTRHKWDKHGAWIEERPLKDEQLSKLIFAVDSNPYLSSEQVTEILQSIAPLVTVYQEPRLAVVTKKTDGTGLPQNVQTAYLVMSEAIGTGQSVRFRKVLPDTGLPSMTDIYFTPKRIILEDGHFYALGVRHVGKCIVTVDLHEIAEIEIVQYRQPKMSKEVERVWRVYESQV
ncbi:MAG: hypothetical protein IJD82_00405 [Clostridia bacterium]|nr:hypothetical protein [Clostridia bacterium]